MKTARADRRPKDGAHTVTAALMCACRKRQEKGEAAVFSSVCLRHNGPNITDKPRRAYVVKYSPTDVVGPESGEARGGPLEATHDGRLLEV